MSIVAVVLYRNKPLKVLSNSFNAWMNNHLTIINQSINQSDKCLFLFSFLFCITVKICRHSSDKDYIDLIIKKKFFSYLNLQIIPDEWWKRYMPLLGLDKHFFFFPRWIKKERNSDSDICVLYRWINSMTDRVDWYFFYIISSMDCACL